uniref:Protein kinase domain-containing protein n=1 Tax=Ditylum brightwellii TaxID=49249 RepID=A0A6U3TPV5_9STRA|mmetsp:Transcript_37849/g.56659  ORF Transcript_37849/g.56659 Transcript_37849/m.56659 type:complete len:1822 (+) Transcript_37849:107-5572(+)
MSVPLEARIVRVEGENDGNGTRGSLGYPVATDVDMMGYDPDGGDVAAVATMVRYSDRSMDEAGTISSEDPAMPSGEETETAVRRKLFRLPLKRWVKRKVFARLAGPRQRHQQQTQRRASRGSFNDLYTLGESLGQGAFSTVLEGIHRQTNEHFAVKAVDKSRLSNDDAIGLQLEISILRDTHHPNIIRLHDVFDEDDRCYLVTERAYGGDLFDRVVSNSYLSEPEARRYCNGLFRAVKHIHDKNIAHRHLKPENILFQTEGQDSVVKLADFGFAKKCTGPNTLLTRCGTTKYVAPEILEGIPYGTQCDMWSLGVIVYVMLGGYVPFNEGNDRELYRKIRSGIFEFHDDYWSQVSIEAKHFIRSLLTVDPARRITAADALESPWMLDEPLDPARVPVDECRGLQSTADESIAIPPVEDIQSDECPVSHPADVKVRLSTALSPIEITSFARSHAQDQSDAQDFGDTCAKKAEDDNKKKSYRDGQRQDQSDAGDTGTEKAKTDNEKTKASIAPPDSYINDDYVNKWLRKHKDGRRPEDNFERVVQIPCVPLPTVVMSTSASGDVEETVLPLEQEQPGARSVNDLPFSASAYYAAVANKLGQNIPASSNLANETNRMDHGERADISSDAAIATALNDIPLSSILCNEANVEQTDNRTDHDEPANGNTSSDTPISDELNDTFSSSNSANVTNDEEKDTENTNNNNAASQDTNPNTPEDIDAQNDDASSPDDTNVNGINHSLPLDADNMSVALPVDDHFSEAVTTNNIHHPLPLAEDEQMPRQLLSSYLNATSTNTEQDNITLLHSFAAKLVRDVKPSDQKSGHIGDLYNDMQGTTNTAHTEEISKQLSSYLDVTSTNINPYHIVKDTESLDTKKLRVVLVGSRNSGKSTIARKLTGKKEDQSGCDEEKFRVYINSWESSDEGRKGTPNMTFEVLDFSSFTHPAPMSMFFSLNSIYCLHWDLAANNPKTWRQGKHPNLQMAYQDPLSSEEDNEYSTEDANRIADRELERSIADDVIFWVDNIIQMVGNKCAILPIVSFNDAFDSHEASRRCILMKQCLLQHYDRLRKTDSKPLPELLWENEDGDANGNVDILRMGNAGNREVNKLKALIEGALKIFPSLSQHAGKGTEITKQVQKKVREMKSKDKIVHVDRILSEINTGRNDKFDKAEITNTMEYLSSIGELYYFGRSNQTGLFDTKDWISHDSSLGDFVVLCPDLLSAVISCLLHKHLPREIAEVQRTISSDERNSVKHLNSWWNSFSGCPSISNMDTHEIWKSMNCINDAAENAAEASYVFRYLHNLCIAHGIISPIVSLKSQSEISTLSVMPSSLRNVPSDIWSCRSRYSWKGALSHSWSFSGSLPPRLMERVTASIVQELFNNSHYCSKYSSCDNREEVEEDHVICRQKPLDIRSINCWKDGVMLDVGMEFTNSVSKKTELSIVNIFIHLCANDSHYCLASSSMCNSDRKLIISAKGDNGGGGQRIWEGGLRLLIHAIERILKKINGCEVKREIACPECITNHHPSEVHVWGKDGVNKAAEEGQTHMRCRKNGHLIETNLLCGTNLGISSGYFDPGKDDSRAVGELFRSVVLVALWDDEKESFESLGSGFVIDRKRGLIVTAAHVLININSHDNFGKEGHGKVLIGVIQEPHHTKKSSKCKSEMTKAEFRYVAEIVAKDPCNVDACVLRITGDIGEGTGKTAHLQQMNFSKHECDLDEKVHVLGFNQGGEGLSEPGAGLNQYLDFAKGYVCKIFRPFDKKLQNNPFDMFEPQKEIVIMCPTIRGQSGGPCVNSKGDVIGILSRADPVDCRRYLVPVSEMKDLVKQARKKYGKH